MTCFVITLAPQFVLRVPLKKRPGRLGFKAKQRQVKNKVCSSDQVAVLGLIFWRLMLRAVWQGSRSIFPG